ncbi:MAG: hypothetical protein ACRD0A_10635 [Acidimicrobiales bacterium]
MLTAAVTAVVDHPCMKHSDARLTLDIYARAVEQGGRAAAEAMGARFLVPPRHGRAMEGEIAGEVNGALTSEKSADQAVPGGRGGGI